MGVGRRAYDLLRGYVNREWDRIQGVEQEHAEWELDEATRGTRPREEFAPVPDYAAPAKAEPTADNHAYARRLLGVEPTATFADVRREFERLNKRSDPTKFPPNSPEAKQAAEIQRRVQWAYAVLSEDADPTERRFRSLEIG